MDLTWHLCDGTSFDSQYRASMALSNHAVLQEGSQTSQQLLQLVAAFLAQALPLLAQSRQGGTGPVSNATALLDRELQPLLQVRQGHHRVDQRRADGPDVRLIDLTAQATSCGQGRSHRQQFLSRGHASFAAAQQHGRQISDPAKTDAAFGQVIEYRHLHGLRLQLLACFKAVRQHKRASRITTHAGGGEARQVVTDPGPLE